MSVDRTHFYSTTRDGVLKPNPRPELRLDGFPDGPVCSCDEPVVLRGRDTCGRCRRQIP